MFFGNALSSYLESQTRFWNTPRDWPEDCSDYIFAARAIPILGRKRFENAWSDSAPSTEIVDKLPENYDIRTDPAEIERGLRLLESARGNSMNWDGLLGSVPKFPTQDEWVQAQSLAGVAHHESWKKYMPFVQVAVELANSARDGKLVTALCHRSGGNVIEQDWHFWNYPSRWLRFELCRVPKESHLMCSKSTDFDFRWIYFRRDSFNALLDRSEKDVVRAEPEATAREVEQKRKRKGSGGRPPEYQWAQFAGELFRRHCAGELPDTQAGIASAMAEWCLDTWGKEPADSQIREKVSVMLAGAVPARN